MHLDARLSGVPHGAVSEPVARAMAITRFSQTRSRKTRPVLFPENGSASRQPAVASLSMARLFSGDVPPITTARW